MQLQSYFLVSLQQSENSNYVSTQRTYGRMETRKGFAGWRRRQLEDLGQLRHACRPPRWVGSRITKAQLPAISSTNSCSSQALRFNVSSVRVE